MKKIIIVLIVLLCMVSALWINAITFKPQEFKNTENTFTYSFKQN